jgi:hypothetical protein
VKDDLPISPELFDEMHELVSAFLAGDRSSHRVDRLQELIRQDLGACDLYLNMVFESSMLMDWAAADPSDAGTTSNQAVAAPPVAFPTIPWAATGALASSWPVAYLIATAIFAIGLILGAIVHVSPPNPVAIQSGSGSSHPTASLPSKDRLVGRISGMVDCRWKADGAKSSPLVAIGDTFDLSSGLLEIVYDTGARVILQGPVTYEVESPASGYLSVGKLTARLEERSEARGQRPESTDQKSEILNDKSFCVRTPTAIVTDLGTEFGVEVDESGATQSQVFRGSVKVRMLSAHSEGREMERVLHENESTRIAGGDGRSILVVPASKSSRFVREMPKQTIKTLDLADVVAGGDGFSNRRGRGIDPTTGRPADTPPRVVPVGDHKFHRAVNLPLIDGVFIPDGGPGPVQISSTGLLFADFPATTNTGSSHVWAGGVVPHAYEPPLPTTLSGVDYASSGHGLIFLHANAGVTIDLAAIRRANPDGKLLRFRAVAGNSETGAAAGAETYWADVWVIVDGQLRSHRREINGTQGGVPVIVPIHASDRFLTLASTDGGDGIIDDYIMFGDPQIDMLLVEPKTESTPQSNR